MTRLLSNFFNPVRTQIRTKILKPRGFKIRTDEVPLQIPEGLAEVQKQLKAENSAENQYLMHPNFFQVHNMFTVTDLFNARIHYGHKEGTLDIRMVPYLFGKRLNHLIFDLDKTALYLRKALNFAAHIAYRDGVILFICRNPQFSYLIEETAIDCGEFAHTRHWRRGNFTNSNHHFGEEIRLPDLCIFINTFTDILQPHTAIKESASMLIPTIGIVDSNCNPNLITYPVPGNDDSLVSIEFYCKVFKEAILRGKQKLKEDTEKEKLDKRQELTV